MYMGISRSTFVFIREFVVSPLIPLSFRSSCRFSIDLPAAPFYHFP